MFLIRKYMSNNNDDIVIMIFTTQYLLYRLILAIILTEKKLGLSHLWEEADMLSIRHIYSIHREIVVQKKF